MSENTFLISPTTQEGVSNDIDAAVQPDQEILDSETPEPQPIQPQSTGSQAATIVAGAGSGAVTGSAFGPWGTAIGAVVGALSSWYGTERQAQAANAANDANQAEASGVRFQKIKDKTESDLYAKRDENAKEDEITWKENDENFKKAQDGVGRMLELFNSQNGFKQALEHGHANMMGTKQQQAYDFKELNPIGRN